MQRPTGVTVLAILAAIGGALGLLGSLAIIGLGAAFAGAPGGGMVGILGFAGLAVSVAALAFAYGAWTLKPWAWPLGMATFGLSAALAVIGLVSGDFGQVLSLAIAAAVIYYLTTPSVKQAFGRA